MPVPLDTDGDGAAEFAVFRRSEGTSYGLDPVMEATSAEALGQASDVPVGQPPLLPAAPCLRRATTTATA